MAAITRTSIGVSTLLPNRRIFRFSKTRNSLAWVGSVHLANFVQQQSSAVRQFEASHPPLGGSGKCAALVPENLTFHQ